MFRPAWVHRQIDAFLAQFCSPRGNEAWIGIRADAPPRPDGQVSALPDMPLAEGFVWRPAGGGEPELWLDPDKSGYRAAFERFAIRELGAPGLDDAFVHIDHVFPKRAAALGGLAYVRMLAVPPESNMAAGRTLERAMAGRNRLAGPRRKTTRMATYFAVGKATGFAGYEALPDEDEAGNQALVGALFAHLRAYGLPADCLGRLDAELTANRATDFR